MLDGRLGIGLTMFLAFATNDELRKHWVRQVKARSDGRSNACVCGKRMHLMQKSVVN